jgi:hypothetical protein
MKQFLALSLVFGLVTATAQTSEDGHYLFSYFIGNGEDGLHLAWSRDGYNWEALNGGKSLLAPTAGKDKLMRDPCIVRGPDGTFHMVWTVSWGEKGIGYAFSKDLVHWSEQQYVPVMEHESGARNCWAPELFYDEATKSFMIYWATTIPGRFTPGDDQKYNHRMYFATTRDFRTFTPTALLYDHGFSVIDATIIASGGKYTMILKDETDKPAVPEKNLRLASADMPEGPYTNPGKTITGDYWAEGPTAIKIGDKWFVYFDKYTQHKYGVITSPDLITWTDESEKLVMPQGIRHGTVFEVSAEVVKGIGKK